MLLTEFVFPFSAIDAEEGGCGVTTVTQYSTHITLLNHLEDQIEKWIEANDKDEFLDVIEFITEHNVMSHDILPYLETSNIHDICHIKRDTSVLKYLLQSVLRSFKHS